MRLALDVSAVPERVAGAGRYMVELARRIPLEGVETTLVTRVGDSPRWSEIASSSKVAPIVPNNRAARLFYEAWRLGTSEVASDVDVWHSPHYTMPHRGSTPVVVTIHDLTYFTNPEWHERSKVAFFRRAISYAAENARVLICVSDFTSRQLDHFFPNHRPTIVAPLGVDLERFNTRGDDDDALFSQNSLPNDRPYVLFVGTVEPRKGLDVLLRSFEELAASHPDVELWIVGQTGWSMRGFEQSLTGHAAASRIRRLGFVDETLLPALFRKAQVVAYPSRGEGFGLPVLEALACGSLVVTTRNTVMAEVAGGTAILVEIGDVKSLAAALKGAIGVSSNERSSRSVISRRQAEQFTWSRTVSQHLIAYQMAAAT